MFVYRTVKEKFYLEEYGPYHGYGICVENEAGEIIDVISDISAEESVVAELAARCTCGELDPEQLRDVVTDYIQTAALPDW